MLFGFGLALAALATASVPVRAQSVEGTWKVSYVTGGISESTVAIVKVAVKDGKTTGEMIAGTPRFKNFAFQSVTQEGNVLRVATKVGATDLIFEATVPKQATKSLRGVMAIGDTLYPATMTVTDETELTAMTSARTLDVAPMKEARTLLNQPLLLRNRAALSKDPEKKKDLLKQASEADKKAKAETPKLFRQVVDQFADSPAVLEASLALIKSGKTTPANPGDVKAWAAVGAAAANSYGPRLEVDFTSQVAAALVPLEGMEKLALEYARLSEKALAPKASAGDQVKVLGTLVKALKKAGAADEAKTLDVRIDKLNQVLDTEYSAKYPGFKGTVFKGREGKSDRAVFMELFTGATCPPCVAADLAFDVLQKTYKPSELVLIQYHMHIPGPDPMTNKDTIARWDYYGPAWAGKPRGVPSSIFNGKPAEKPAQSGGFFEHAEQKYADYCNVINPLLEEKADVKLVVAVSRDGDQININAKVSDLNEPGATKKLRILLAEETVHYAGSNKIRLHHNVVRAFPGGVEGMTLKDAASVHKTSIKLGELRTSLTKYLDDFEANVREFANPARPMAMEHLRVIAFVQDDESRQILQAVQVDVK